MKKTVSVNIKGTNFLIEEDAYELLQDYLDRLTIALKNEQGSQEIIEDIELRIAEICSAKLTDIKTVIELADIEETLEALGDPSDYVDEEEFDAEETSTKSNYSGTSGEKRLFRDPHSSMLGGVCAGVANYFNIDVVIIRAIFLVLGIFGGFGIPLYIVMWIIIPKAESTIDRLRMKGRPITVETVKEEVEDAAERIRAGSRNLADRIRNDKHYNERMSRGRSILRTILGMIFLLIGLGFLIGFIVFFVEGFEFLPVKGDQGFMSITEYGELSLNSPSDVKWMWIGGLLASISGIVLLFSLGTLLIFNLSNRWTKAALGTLTLFTLAGGIMCGVIGLKAGRDWATEYKVEGHVFDVNTEELQIIPTENTRNLNAKRQGSTTRQIGWFGVKGNKLCKYGVDIEYAPSKDSLFHVYQYTYASGYSATKAEDRAEHIRHAMLHDHSKLYVSTQYLFPKEDKLRGQSVKVRIEIPDGKRVRINNDIIDLNDLNDQTEELPNREYGRLSGTGEYYHDSDY